jgi:hypothetical protein
MKAHLFCSRILRVFSLSLALLVIAGLAQAGPGPKLSSDHEVASAGFFQLSWDAEGKRVELQEASSQAFRNPTVLYIGPDSKSVISGKANGGWYYRVRTLEPQLGTWSNTVVVKVAHHDLSRALMFLSLGIIVFIAIVAMIVRGERARQ